MVFQLPSAALAGLQPNPSAEGAWGCLWLTAQQADPMARSNLSCATTAPRGTGSGRLGFSEALLALEIMTKSVLCVFNSNLHGGFWSFFVAVWSSDPQWSFCHVHTTETKEATGLTPWGGFSFWLSWRNVVAVFYFVNWHPFWQEHLAGKKKKQQKQLPRFPGSLFPSLISLSAPKNISIPGPSQPKNLLSSASRLQEQPKPVPWGWDENR